MTRVGSQRDRKKKRKSEVSIHFCKQSIVDFLLLRKFKFANGNFSTKLAIYRVSFRDNMRGNIYRVYSAGEAANEIRGEFYVLFIVHLLSVLVNNQLDAQFFFSYIFIPVLYMFRAHLCSSSGESTVSIRHLIYVTLCR